AAGDADPLDAGADQLAAIGDQHELVLVLDRERGDELAGFLPDAAVALAHVHRNDAFSATTSDAVLERRGALAVTAFGNREHELLGRRHFHVALLAKRDRVRGFLRLLGVKRRLFALGAVETAADRTCALQIGSTLLGGRVDVPEDGQRDDLVAFGECDATHAHRGATLEDAHVGNGEADALPARAGEQNVVALGADLNVDDALPLVELHSDDAGTAHIDEVGKLVAPYGAAGRGEHHVELAPTRLVLRQRHHGRDQLTRLQRQDVDQRLAARLRRRLRQPPHLLLVDAPVRGEEQHWRVRGGHEQPRDEILFAGLHAGAALAAAPLRPIGRQRHALDIAKVGDGHHHVLAVNEIFLLHLAFLFEDDGAARRGELLAHGSELVLHDALDARPR